MASEKNKAPEFQGQNQLAESQTTKNKAVSPDSIPGFSDNEHCHSGLQDGECSWDRCPSRLITETGNGFLGNCVLDLRDNARDPDWNGA